MRRLVWLAAALCGCPPQESSPEQPPVVAGPTVADEGFLAQSLWDDGMAEVTFYDGWFDDEGVRRDFTVGTYLIKHAFDPVRQTKADDGIVDFKYALFYEFVAGSEQFKRSFVVNAARKDLRPLKASANSFDWCANQYRELAFTGAHVHRLMRSDDYGNAEGTSTYHPSSFAAVQMPLLMRALDFSKSKDVDFEVVTFDGTLVGAMAELIGTETITTRAGETQAQKIRVHYANPIESVLGVPSQKETYWRATDAARHLVRLEAEDAKYGLEIVETLRSAYWQEDIFPRLTRVRAHP